MSEKINLNVDADISPKQLAMAFWSMNSEEQAKFYEHLHKIAGNALIFQAQAIIDEIADTENDEACLGFCVLHDYAAGYVENGIERRHWKARHMIDLMTREARSGLS